MPLRRGSRNSDTLTGTSLDDLFAGLGGNDTLIGGEGTDTAWYSGNLAGYHFSSDGGRLVVRDSAPVDGNDGMDTLTGMEKLQFGDSQLGISGGEFRANTFTLSDQLEPSVAALAGGGFVLSWASFNPDNFGYSVHAQRYDVTGATAGAEFGVNTFTNGDQSSPTVTALAGGGFVVSWESYLQDGSGYGIYGQRYDAMGTPAGAEFRVNTVTYSSQSDSTIAALADGGFVVCWQSHLQDGSGYGIYGQRYDTTGAPAGTEFSVNTSTTDDQSAPAVAALADGGFVVSWQSWAQDGSDYGIFAKRFNAFGVDISGDFQVNTFTNGNQISPTVTALAGGGYVISWQSWAQDGSDSGVFAKRYDATGAAAGAEFRVNTFTSGFQESPSIAALAGGGFVVSWQSYRQDGSGYGIYAQRYDATGAAAGTEFRVNTTTSGDQWSPTVAALVDGGFVVSWQSYLQDGSGHGIYAQRYDTEGRPVGVTLTGTPAADLIHLDPGGLVVVDAAGGNDTVNGASGDDTLAGGAGNDALRGYAGNDLLDGGIGADSLAGGVGDDLYLVDNAADVIVELAGEGNDSVQSSVSFTLSATVENLTLTGSDNLNATGNAGGNLIEGNAGNNRLDGGAGVDILAGGNGDDTYLVDSAFDAVEEPAGGGTDEVRSTVTITALAANVEYLSLAGTQAIDGTGNDADNSLLGNSAANRLEGLGGADSLNGLAGNDTLLGGAGNDSLAGGLGSDSLTGGAGADKFIFHTAPGAANLDILADFSAAADDEIYLSRSVFTGLGEPARPLPTDAFRSGAGITTAGDATDRIIYNSTTGDLFYDADGAGGAAAVRFAVLTGAPALTAADFFVTP